MPLLQDIFSTEHIQMMEELVNGSEWTTVLDLFMKNVPNLMNLIEAPEMVSNIVNEIASQYFATFKAVMEGLSQNSTEMDPDAVAK
ncbi:hypothetical protein DPMN_036744 [Dreissena polymorpha]|uniref:Uncharacterized protein n=3 Tax=Dreissena polymorpha TaxID=45954 RepID=A0A9D4MDJ7_DREPO|nr:hypothetical protein DPMN_036634 [Dreissena polymorpha]KAH3873507.1 hypothetical protein DPMN_036744 [Dreissena polymorpha]